MINMLYRITGYHIIIDELIIILIKIVTAINKIKCLNCLSKIIIKCLSPIINIIIIILEYYHINIKTLFKRWIDYYQNKIK